MTSPSPQIGAQAAPTGLQAYPVYKWQVESQPSPVTLLPSSQVSVGLISIESPQTTVQICPSVGQVYPL
jgi:hypothetical protein